VTMSETPSSLLVAASRLSSSCNSRTSCATLHEGGEADGVLSKPRVGGSNPSRRAKLPTLDCFLPGGGGPSCGPDSGFSLRLRGASENLASATIEFGTKCSVPGPARAPATGTQGRCDIGADPMPSFPGGALPRALDAEGAGAVGTELTAKAAQAVEGRTWAP